MTLKEELQDKIKMFGLNWPIENWVESKVKEAYRRGQEDEAIAHTKEDVNVRQAVLEGITKLIADLNTKDLGNGDIISRLQKIVIDN